MKAPLPSTLHGWHPFLGEVGIIVFGVLIALGAQQLVDHVSRQADMHEFRAATDAEIGRTLGTYQARLAQDGCVTRKLDDLERWLALWQDSKGGPISGAISGPRSQQPYTSVWASRDPALMSSMTLKDRLTYSAIYDGFANNEVQRLDERVTWFELGAFEGARTLTAQDMMRLRGLLKRARWRAGNITGNSEEDLAAARVMGIKAQTFHYPAEATREICEPLRIGTTSG